MESGQLIRGAVELQLYFSALRQKVLRSLSRQQEAVFFQLAALALQAERGDLEIPEPQHKHYFLLEDYFPPWLIKRRGREYLLQHSPKLHKDLRGATQREAVLEFVKLSNTVEDVPITFYRMRREKKELKNSILFGIAVNGVRLYQDVEGKQCLLHELTWTHMEQVSFQGCRLEIVAVGSLCLSKLVFYCPSALHAALVLKHLRNGHRVTISIRNALSQIRLREEAQGQQTVMEEVLSSLSCEKNKMQH